jgi:putative ABC transport system permease protein
MTRPRLRSPAGTRGSTRGGRLRREIGAVGASALLVLRRVRTDLVAILGITALIALTAVLATLVPAHITSTLDQAAREAVAAAGADADLRLLATTGDAAGGNPTTAERLLTFSTEVPDLLPSTLSEVASQLSVGILGPEVAGRIDVGTVRVRIGVLDPTATPLLQVVGGALPVSGAEAAPGAAAPSLPVVISAAAADATVLAVGDSFTVGEASSDEDLLLTVVAVVDTAEVSAQAWTDLPGLWDPQVLTSQGDQTGERFTVLTDAAAFDSVSARFPETADATLRTSFDPSRFDLQRFLDVRESIDGLETSPASLTESSPVSVAVSSDYERVLDAFPSAAAAARAQLSTLAAGLLGVAILVTVLASTALTRRRQSEIELLRSRGASLPLIVSHAAAESIALTLLGLAAGVGVAALLGFRAGSPLLLGGAAVFVLTPVLSTLSQALAAPSRRRVGVLRVAGISALVATAVTAVVALRSGAGEAGGSIDPLSLAAPVLCAGVAALALSPLPALLLRVTSAFTARTRGPATLLAGASARDGRALVTLVALTLAVSVAVTSLVLLHTVAAGQESASWRAVGADARVEGAPDPAALVRAFTDAGSTAAAVVERPGLTLDGLTAATRATLLAVDDDYARLLAALPGAEPAADAVAVGQLLQPNAADGAPEPLPVLADRRLTALAGEDSVAFEIDGVLVPVIVVGSVTAAEPTAVVDRARLDAYLETNGTASASAGATAQPASATVLAVGPGSDRVAASELAAEAEQIVLRSDVLAQLRDGALVAGVASATTLSLLGTALLAVLALLTTTVIGVRRRGRVLALLGALGVPKHTGVALAVGELAPLVVSGVLGGCLASAAVLTLAGGAFGSAILAGGDAPLRVAAWLPLAVLAAAALALALALAVDTPLSRRVRTADILRTGEES